MKSLNEMANKVLDAYPVTRDYLKKVIAVESLHTSTNLAITRLLEIIESQQAQLEIGSRTRKFRKCWVNVLLRMAIQTIFRYVDHESLAIPRKKFLEEVGANDFSLMKHWGLICHCGGHKWSISKKGIGFILGIPGYRFVADSIIQVGGIKDNYRRNPKATPVEIGNFEYRYLCDSEREILQNIFNGMED